MTENSILEQLDRADEFIGECLADRGYSWSSMLSDHSYPHIERLWTRFDDMIAVVHRILPIPKKETPLLHWHRRPMGFLLKDGAYWEDQGFAPPGGPPPCNLNRRLCLPGERRAMVRSDAWHLVRPKRHSVMSVCVFGPVYPGVPALETTRDFSRLSPERFERLLAAARTNYGIPA